MPTFPFDTYAPAYDQHFTFSPIGILQRKRVFKFLVPLLNKKQKVLEINSGTGHDALTIAPHVEHVDAFDISSAMIAEANRKKEALHIDNVVFKTCDTRELPFALKNKYDLIFSDFGGLNCLTGPEIEQFAKNITAFINGNGTLALVIMGKKCVWENFFFFWQRDPRLRRRNTYKGIETKIGGNTFNTYYHSPGEIKKYFGPAFKVVRVKPIGLFIPPSYLNSYFSRKPFILKILLALETIFGNFSFLSDHSDHYLIVLQKK